MSALDERQPWVDEPIRLVPYDPTWPARFEDEAKTLRRVLGAWATGGVHHVGSTAVPGLMAKPILDIQVGVLDLASSRACVELLEPLHYHYAPYRDDVMHWFCKPDPSRRTHHLHLVPTTSSRFADVLAFRDYLRAHAAVAREYEALKRELAARHTNDREAYTEGKTELVQRITSRAREWSRA